MIATAWLDRIKSLARTSTREAESASPAPVVRSAPGLAALFEALEDDRSHAVLDLGAAAESSLFVYSRIARQVRFSDLSARPAPSLEWASALEEARDAAVEPYDVLLVWDTLGRLTPDDRARMVARLVELAAPDARLHMVLEAPEKTGPRPLGFSLADRTHMRHELTGDDPASPSRLLPSHVEKMLAPFQVVHAFTLKDGLREYVALLRPRVSREQRPHHRAEAGINPGSRRSRSAPAPGAENGTIVAKGRSQPLPPPEKS